MSRTGAKGVALPGGPAGAFAIAFGAVGAVYLMMKYVRRQVKNFLSIRQKRCDIFRHTHVIFLH